MVEKDSEEKSEEPEEEEEPVEEIDELENSSETSLRAQESFIDEDARNLLLGEESIQDSSLTRENPNKNIREISEERVDLYTGTQKQHSEGNQGGRDYEVMTTTSRADTSSQRGTRSIGIMQTDGQRIHNSSQDHSKDYEIMRTETFSRDERVDMTDKKALEFRKYEH